MNRCKQRFTLLFYSFSFLHCSFFLFKKLLSHFKLIGKKFTLHATKILKMHYRSIYNIFFLRSFVFKFRNYSLIQKKGEIYLLNSSINLKSFFFRNGELLKTLETLIFGILVKTETNLMRRIYIYNMYVFKGFSNYILYRNFQSPELNSYMKC